METHTTKIIVQLLHCYVYIVITCVPVNILACTKWWLGFLHVKLDCSLKYNCLFQAAELLQISRFKKYLHSFCCSCVCCYVYFQKKKLYLTTSKECCSWYKLKNIILHGFLSRKMTCLKYWRETLFVVDAWWPDRSHPSGTVSTWSCIQCLSQSQQGHIPAHGWGKYSKNMTINNRQSQ